MAYAKTEWKPRIGAGLNRFEKEQESSRSVILHNTPHALSQQGTPFSAQRMNKIEDGIGDAHGLIAAEEQARIQGDASTLAGANANASGAVSSHNSSSSAHQDIRNITSSLIGLPSWDPAQSIITFTARSGATLSIDLPLEMLAQDIDYDEGSKEIIITRKDGSVKRISVSDLIDVYTGSSGANIQITVGPGNVISAVLLAGSVSEAHLDAALAAKLDSMLAAAAIQPSEPSASSTDAQVTSAKRLWQMMGAALSSLKTSAKTITGALNELFDSKLNASARGAANGVASLDAQGLIPLSQLPSTEEQPDPPFLLWVEDNGDLRASGIGLLNSLFRMDADGNLFYEKL